ncbi:MAG TPA: polysaccharide deacetylase family protein [Terriglobales bacterium]|nr:polysaccharide deacetylase family protein [Terriglobales bacterium]
MTDRHTRNLWLLLSVLCLSCAALAQTTIKSVQERLGYPADARLLIIHADDLGMNHSVNRATFEALEKNWITSSSILVPCPWFPEVARWAKDHPTADLGIHQALNSEWTTLRWGPVSPTDKVPSLLAADGNLPLDTDIVAKNAKPEEVEAELRAQIDRAQSAGIHLTHLDTHMAALFGSTDLYRVYQKMGYRYGLPILEEWEGTHGPLGVSAPREEMLVQKVISINPGIDAKDWTAWYEKALAPLPAGVYEVIVHLAYDDEEMRGATFDHPDWGAAWRQHDFDMVKSAEFQKFLKDQGFVMVGWKDLAKALPSDYGKSSSTP